MNDMLKNVILRADGNGEIGYGHLSRLNALANIIRTEFRVVFLTRYDSNISLIDKDIEIVKIPKGISFKYEVEWINKIFSSRNNFIVADGYQFSSSYQKMIKNLGYTLIFIDDLVVSHMYADFVINHAIGVDESLYSGESYVKYFLGSEYALLRNSFIEISKIRQGKVLKFETAFVSFGGTDSSKITMSAVNALLNFKKFKKIYVVVGKSFTDINQIEFLKENVRTELFIDVAEKVISKLMSNSDFAIAPASTISYELASSRCVIASGFTAENQLHIYNGLLNKDIIFGLGDITDFEEEDFNRQIKTILNSKKEGLKRKIKNQSKYFDGNQKERYLKIFNSLKIEN
jgi:UDP-2,4-diacetamido-2,4,6-trideoxy-beta-L-altropyranose hydrolase